MSQCVKTPFSKLIPYLPKSSTPKSLNSICPSFTLRYVQSLAPVARWNHWYLGLGEPMAETSREKLAPKCSSSTTEDGSEVTSFTILSGEKGCWRVTKTETVVDWNKMNTYAFGWCNDRI
jgi:hypothetical protein